MKYKGYGITFITFIKIQNSLGKLISNDLVLRIFLYIMLEAVSEEIIIGILKLFLSVKGVLIKPGLITLTCKPINLHWWYIDSAKLIRADLEEQYAAAYGNPL